MSYNENIPLKKCTKCEIEKPLDQFHKSTNSKKSSYHCKSCISIRDKERYVRCREEVITWTKQMYEGEELDFQLSLVASLNKAEIIMMVIRISETTVINLFVLNLLLSDSKINNQFINL